MDNQSKADAVLKMKRRQMGLTQKKMAELIGCSPSALCMFEKGKSDALSVERLNKACEILQLPQGALLEGGDTYYCSNPLCPTHHPYAIGNEIALKPDPVVPSVGEKHCGWCGDVLVAACENCQAPFDGFSAYCSRCGTAYLTPPEGYHPSPASQELLQQLRSERAAFAAVRQGG